tara:strand:+ start:384 stop:599 length:216 start_codon:yes stop_codon:yes gene_type:complete
MWGFFLPILFCKMLDRAALRMLLPIPHCNGAYFLNSVSWCTFFDHDRLIDEKKFVQFSSLPMIAAKPPLGY